MLREVNVFITDTDPNSKYFVASKIPSHLTSGKNYFFIAGSDFLEEGSGVVIEILNSKDEKIEYSISDYIFNGVDRMIIIELPPDPILDTATITILGQLVDVPDNWKHKWNVKWTKILPINTTLENLCTPIFKNNPYITVQEVYNEDRDISNYLKEKTIYNTGQVYSKIEGSKSDKNTIYTVIGSNFVKDMKDGKLFISQNDIQLNDPDLYEVVDYDGLIKEVVNDTKLIMQMSYKAKNIKTLQYDTLEFNNSNYYIEYGLATTGSNENVRNSYLRLNFNNISTYGGFVKYIDIYKNPGNVYIGQYLLKSEELYTKQFTTISDFTNNFSLDSSGNVEDIKYNEITNVKNLRSQRIL